MATWVLHVDASLDEVNQQWAALTSAGMIGAAEIDGRTAVYFRERAADPGVAGRWERLADRDWHERWRLGLTPVHAGRWTVTPSWLATGADDEIVIDPGQAFGTGHHETTAACLRALDALALDGRAVLDVGTGTGVLAIAAAKAGAYVTAVDVDPVAVTAARANAARNGVVIDVLPGGPDAAPAAAFDVLVANLDTATVVATAAAHHVAARARGVLIASGVSNARRHEAQTALTRAGFDVTATPGAEWTVLHCRRAAA